MHAYIHTSYIYSCIHVQTDRETGKQTDRPTDIDMM